MNELYAQMLNAEVGGGGSVESNGITISSVTMPESEITQTSFKVYIVASADNGIAKIEYSNNGGGSYTTGASQTDTSYTFTGLTAGTKYYVRIRITDSKGNVAYYPSSSTNIEVSTKEIPGVKIVDIFQKTREDQSGYDANKLHVGDFVSYDAGTWTASQINAIKTGNKGSEVVANGVRSLPTGQFQFGGFATGDSRNGNAVPYNTSYDTPTNGWRIFDVADDGTVTLISAGNPEDYYHPYGANYGYISEYILSGNVVGGISASSYTKRDWGMYVNSSQYATSATTLTKTRLDQWYDRYMGTTNADVWTAATFQLIQGKKYESIIDNYTHHWLSSANSSTGLYCVYPSNRGVNRASNIEFGVRVLVSLSSDVKANPTPATKSVTYRGVTTNYKSWTIQ